MSLSYFLALKAATLDAATECLFLYVFFSSMINESPRNKMNGMEPWPLQFASPLSGGVSSPELVFTPVGDLVTRSY